MSGLTAVVLGVAMLAIGVALGMSGYGGFLVAPLLVWLAGLTDARTAVAYALLAAILPTLLGAVLYRRSHRTPWLLVATLCAGTVPGILVGHWLTGSVSDSVLHLLIGSSVAAAGMAVLGRPPQPSNRPQASDPPEQVRRPSLVRRGLVAGGLSGVAGVVVGVGGPLVTTPILLSSGLGLTGAIGAGLANGVLVNVVGGLSLVGGVALDPLVLSLVAVPQLVGVVLGVRLHRTVSPTVLTRVVAGVAVAVGARFVLDVALR